LRDGAGAQPVQFGQRELRCAALLRLLRESGYDGALVVELAPAEEPLEAAIAARQYLERIL